MRQRLRVGSVLVANPLAPTAGALVIARATRAAARREPLLARWIELDGGAELIRPERPARLAHTMSGGGSPHVVRSSKAQRRSRSRNFHHVSRRVCG